MDAFCVIKAIGFTVFTLILFFISLLLLSEWLPKRLISRLQRNGLPVLRIPPVWYLLAKFLLPRNQEFHPVVKMTQWSLGINLLFRKEGIVAATSANSTFVHIFKPEYVEAIMTSNTLINKPWIYDLIKPLLGNGLLISAGEQWRARRKLLTPAFHFKILETFMPIFNSHSFTLVRKVKSRLENQLDIIPMLSYCTLDVIAETAMGVKINSQENEDSEYVKSIVRLEELITERTMYPWYWYDFIYFLTPKGKECKRALKIVHDFTRKVVSERKSEVKQQLEEGTLSFNKDSESDNIYMTSKKRMAFLDLLLHCHLTDGSISEKEICEEVDTFMFEGHDTTAMSSSWTLYSLGLYPEIQEKAYNEIEDIFGNDREREVTVDDLRKMKYLECVIKEALRIFPAVPFIDRCNPEKINILGKTILPKAVYNISIAGLHMDDEIYPNPHVFDPERFFPENSAGRHRFAYIPFSAGPRNCIGQKFAMMEEKTIICNVLRHFRIESLHPRDKVVSCSELVLRPIGGLHLRFEER